MSGISWTDKDCNIDSTYIVYEKWKQGRRFIAGVNGEYFIYQTITNSNPAEHYVVDSLSLDWISFKGDSLFVKTLQIFAIQNILSIYIQMKMEIAQA